MITDDDGGRTVATEMAPLVMRYHVPVTLFVYQIYAAEKFGSDGWMLWNPKNVYFGAGLLK